MHVFTCKNIEFTCNWPTKAGTRARPAPRRTTPPSALPTISSATLEGSAGVAAEAVPAAPVLADSALQRFAAHVSRAGLASLALRRTVRPAAACECGNGSIGIVVERGKASSKHSKVTESP